MFFSRGRALFIAHKAVSDFLYEQGNRDRDAAAAIYETERYDDSEPEFSARVHKHKGKSARMIALGILLEVGAFWTRRSVDPKVSREERKLSTERAGITCGAMVQLTRKAFPESPLHEIRRTVIASMMQAAGPELWSDPSDLEASAMVESAAHLRSLTRNARHTETAQVNNPVVRYGKGFGA